MRFYVTGRVAVETKDRIVDETQLPSRQTRLLLPRLVLDRARASSREELAEFLWREKMPTTWDVSLKAVISKLRGVLERLDESSTVGISGQYGCYQLELPTNAWVDWEEAKASIDQAEGALRRSDTRRAWGPANVALIISRREFLPGENGDWVEAKRRELDSIFVRAADAYASVCLASHQSELAIPVAEEAIRKEPFRETGYQNLMKAQAALGNRAEGLRVYHRCRDLLREELGVSPSPETEAVYVDLLKNERRGFC